MAQKLETVVGDPGDGYEAAADVLRQRLAQLETEMVHLKEALGVRTWTMVEMADDVTPEVLAAAEGIFDGWHTDEERIDWDSFLDRLDGSQLVDGTWIDLGGDLGSPAIRKIKTHIHAYRRLTP